VIKVSLAKSPDFVKILRKTLKFKDKKILKNFFCCLLREIKRRGHVAK